MSTILEKIRPVHAMNSNFIAANEDIFNGSPASDVINLENAEGVLFIIACNANAGSGAATATVLACDNVTPSNTAAVRFGWETRIPLVTRVLPLGVSLTNRYPVSLSVLGWDAQNLLLVDARPARYGVGIILHIREIEGQNAALNFSSRKTLAPIRQIDEVNVLEEALTENKPKLSFKPYETKFVRLLF